MRSSGTGILRCARISSPRRVQCRTTRQARLPWLLFAPTSGALVIVGFLATPQTGHITGQIRHVVGAHLGR
ncbi:hypothetical protein [Saccharopolyspora sp. 5N708]|uniref:hypothetical protein n=1 Tax=Saccharopolyspora sp. 5N708 TaxID=3457424 RepID=UPI003FD4465E